MRIKSLSLILPALFLLQSYLYAQEKSKVQFGKVSPADFTLPASSIIDSNANAVILSDVGSIHFIGNDKDWFSYVFKRQIRIKILNKKAIEQATVKLQLYADQEDQEKLENLGGSTYNLEDGKVVETKLEKKDIFEDRLNKYYIEKKFTLPAVKEGSIIEYTYTRTWDYYFRLPEWEFQSEQYPCLWSEYSVEIPQTLTYIFVKQGYHVFCIDKASDGHQSYRVTRKSETTAFSGLENSATVNANTVKHQWAMKDIPAFRAENYLSTPKNYTDKLEFQLSQTYNGEDINAVSNSWKKATEEWLKREDFGGALQADNEWLNELLGKIVENSMDKAEQARAIYYYVSGHFTCTYHSHPYLTTNLRDVVKKGGGTVGDLNLLLIALLHQVNIPADPVLLSTREHGFNLPRYPVRERLNYVIARVKMDDKIYYLDASHPLLGFGQLPVNCFNGHARIISVKDSGSVYFYADSLKEKKTSMVLLSADEKGVLGGSYQTTIGYPGSYLLRERLGRTGEKEYFKEIQTSYGEDLDISNTGIDSLNKPEMPVKVYYDFTLKQASGSSIIYLNPLFETDYLKNPFQSQERKYPVEMYYAPDNVYVFNMDIPDGYVVDELPKSARVAFNGTEGLFEYLIGQQGNSIQLRSHIKLDRANFLPEDYSALRDFFAYIVKKQSEQIVLKKKN